MCSIHKAHPLQTLRKAFNRLFSEDFAVEMVFSTVVTTSDFSLLCLFKARGADIDQGLTLTTLR